MRFYPPLLIIISAFWVISCRKGQQEQVTVHEPAPVEWRTYQGDLGRNQYSPLDQINRENVRQLQVAWEYHTGDVDENARTQIQCNPIIVDGVLYGTSPKLKVFALEAATGKKHWEFNPNTDTNFGLNVNRGVMYWESGTDKRILFTAGDLLIALNAETGKPVKSFGVNGVASLKQKLGARAAALYVVSTSPGVIYENLLIIGTRVSENADAAPGHIRAFDVKSGDVVWTFRTIPHPHEFGYETWPEEAYQSVGGANAWAGLSLDPERGIVFAPTGSAAYDFYGGNRKGENLFANCILALDAKTGKRIWHFQTVHHDLWDRDLPAPPNLVSVNHDGKTIDAVAQITKSGFVFLFNRETGEPLFPIEEVPVKASDLSGEEAWPTQPIPVKPPPFARQKFTKEMITERTPKANQYVEDIFEKVISEGQFVPPSKEGTMIFPGFDGGGEWGGAAVDPISNILYVNANEMPWILTMIEPEDESIETEEQQTLATAGKKVYDLNCAVCHAKDMKGDPSGTYPSLVDLQDRFKKEELMAIINNGKGFMPAFKHISDESKNILTAFLLGLEMEIDPHMLGMEENRATLPYRHTGYNRFVDEDGYPAVQPPWGTLNAIDLNKGEILWKVPLGSFEALMQQGIPQTGTENYGGPAVTAGGLIFIAASKDEYFRAFDKDTGQEVWKYKLPAGGYATPSVYEVAGKQYVVIACGGGKMGTKSGDSYLAFSLP